MLQIRRRKSQFKPLKYSEVPEVPAFSSTAKEKEKCFNFLQISNLHPLQGQDQNDENPTNKLLLSMPPEDPEITLKVQLLHNAHPVQPRGQDALWPSTKQGETGTDLLSSLSHFKVIKDVIFIRLQKKNQAPLSRTKDMKKPNELHIFSPNLPSSLLQKSRHQPPAILFPLQLSS